MTVRGSRSGSRKRPRKRTRAKRVGTARRRALLLLSIIVLGTAMVVSIRRTAEGRRITEALNALATEEQVLRAQLAIEVLRVDSLSSLDRIEDAAAELGLRWPRDDEWELMLDVGTSERANRSRSGNEAAR